MIKDKKFKALQHWWLSGGDPLNKMDLISYWNFDTESYSPDYASGGNIGTDNLITFGAGKINSGKQFVGVSSYVSVQDSPSLSFDGGSPDRPFSWAMWVNPTNFAAQRVLLMKRSSAGTGEYQILIDQTTGAVRFTLFSGNNSSVFLTKFSTVGLSASQWSLVTVTYDGSGTLGGIKIYINAVESATSTNTGGSYVSQSNSTSVLVFGQRSYELTSSFGFIGSLDEIGLFGKALTQSDVSTIYNSGSGRYYNYTHSNVMLDIYDVNYNVLATRGNYQFLSDGTNLYWSDDRGTTLINEYVWGVQFSGTVVADKGIDFAYIFSDGTLIFSCTNKMYRSTDKLETITEVLASSFFNEDGSPFSFHTPSNALFPGHYFQRLTFSAHSNDDILVWGNYCNVNIGAAPVQVWATTDKGETFTALYRFGQNPQFRDNGTNTGGASGTLLGDSSNSVIARHVHSVVRDGESFDWYACTGDSTGEVHWFKYTFNPDTEEWSSTHLIDSAAQNSRYKALGLLILNGLIYWGSDATGTVADSERGVFVTPLEDIGVTEERISYTINDEVSSVSINSNGKLLYYHIGSSVIYVSRSLGVGQSINYTVPNSSNGMSSSYPPDSEGWIKINIGRHAANQEITRTIFVR